MKPGSLTLRLSLLFVVAVAVVTTFAPWMRKRWEKSWKRLTRSRRNQAQTRNCSRRAGTPSWGHIPISVLYF